MGETRRVLVLGSTGSIGCAALDVIASLDGTLHAVGVSANTRWMELAAQVKKFRPGYAAVTDPSAADKLRAEVEGTGTIVFGGDGAMTQLVQESAADVVLAAVVGAAALGPVMEAIRKRVPILALANKESVVMAGHLVLEEARKNDVRIVPVDSEHNAIFQAMRAGEKSEVKRVILTASGGPFRGRKPSSLAQVTPLQALDHPTWKMGTKVTIDSATLMNKALEMVEAKWLFNLDASQISVVIHPESIIHSLVEFRDGSVIAQMGHPDMRSPIQFALTYPRRVDRRTRAFDLAELGGLTFESADERLYPALALGRYVVETGGTTGAVFNAANEAAGQGFLSGRIRFPQICEVVQEVLRRHRIAPSPDLDQIFAADRWAREESEKCMS